MKLDIISKDVARGDQDVIYTEVAKTKDDLPRVPSKLKICIRSDSYRNQCHADIWLWSGFEWKLIHNIHYSKMQTPDKLYYDRQDGTNERNFRADRDELLKVAEQILA